MRIHKKIFYVSGIISLILIFPIFWYYANSTLSKMNLRVLDIGLPYKAKNGEKTSEYTKIPMVGWKYKPIKIPANFDKNKENEFVLLIQKLKNEKIEKSGLKFQFNDNNSYDDFVKMLNIMMKTEQEFYGLDIENTNSLYVLYFKPVPKNNYPLYNDEIIETYRDQKDYNYKNSLFWEKLIQYSPKESFYLFFGYLILLYSSILKPKLSLNI